MATNRRRTDTVMFYVTPEEKARMKELANRVDMSLSDYARKVMLGKLALEMSDNHLYVTFDERTDNNG